MSKPLFSSSLLVSTGLFRSVSISATASVLLFASLVGHPGSLLAKEIALHTASTVISYDPGAGAAVRFANPHTALGAPAQSNPFGEPTDPFNPPYGTNQIVSIGAGGHLILGFNTPVLNHPNNPFGRDFTIFGNAGFVITNEFDLMTFGWVGVPATDGSLFGEATGEFLVSVSTHGGEFFVLNPLLTPRIDAFPPTDGSGHPGVPVAPDLVGTDFAGATLAGIQAVYAGSAGGASFDLDWALDTSGRTAVLPAIRFIRIDVLTGRLEIDGVTAVNRVSRGRR